jgi:putative endonuclease
MSTDKGQHAEAVAARFLKQQGFRIIEQNWRTPRCEIDIVAQKADVIYFTEVKYRSNQETGGGIAYITPKKIRQMEYAALQWVESTQWEGDYELSAIEVTGSTYQVSHYLQTLT